MAKKRILIVDDNLVALEMAASFLEEAGYAVQTTSFPLEALRVATIVQPDLMILDVVMPAMDGLKLARKLRMNPSTAKIPVMFLSVRKQELEVREALELGVVAYVKKPFRRETIVPLVRKLLSQGAKRTMR